MHRRTGTHLPTLEAQPCWALPPGFCICWNIYWNVICGYWLSLSVRGHTEIIELLQNRGAEE